MSQRLIVDTVAAIAFLNEDITLAASLRGDEIITVPIIVLGELYGGAEQSSKVEQNRKRVDEFAAKRRIIYCDQETARQYGFIIAQLRRKGRPIPQNDMWIAALALQHKMTLLTRDNHFQQVDGLVVRGW